MAEVGGKKRRQREGGREGDWCMGEGGWEGREDKEIGENDKEKGWGSGVGNGYGRHVEGPEEEEEVGEGERLG